MNLLLKLKKEADMKVQPVYLETSRHIVKVLVQEADLYLEKRVRPNRITEGSMPAGEVKIRRGHIISSTVENPDLLRLMIIHTAKQALKKNRRYVGYDFKDMSHNWLVFFSGGVKAIIKRVDNI